MDVEESFDFPGLVACLDGRNVLSSRHSDGMEPGQTRTHSGVLRDQSRHERVLENVERFIQVRPGMQRRDTGAEANPISAAPLDNPPERPRARAARSS